MIRRPPRSTLFPYHDALPICSNPRVRRRTSPPRRAEPRQIDLTFEPFHQRMARQFLPQSLSDRKSTRLNSSHANISYAVFCLKKKKTNLSLITYYSILHQVLP